MWLGEILAEHGDVARRIHRGVGGSEVALGDKVVVKVHPGPLCHVVTRMNCVTALPELFLQPIDGMRAAPDGRVVTVWPKVPTLKPDEIDWLAIGHLLARLHETTWETRLPPHGWARRVDSALARSSGDVHRVLSSLKLRLDERGPDRERRLVHGDFHLGQVAKVGPRHLLLDLDDLSQGDPVWDLARPAGFWAAGLLADDAYRALIHGYGQVRELPQPLWPALDLPARIAVCVAAVSRHRIPDEDRTALVEAVRRMAG